MYGYVKLRNGTRVKLHVLQAKVTGNYVENKMPTGCNRLVYIAKLIVRSTCLGHHYAHRQELKSFKDGCCLWYMTLWFTGRWSGVEL